jgi:hypothetical protein
MINVINNKIKISKKTTLSELIDFCDKNCCKFKDVVVNGNFKPILHSGYKLHNKQCNRIILNLNEMIDLKGGQND